MNTLHPNNQRATGNSPAANIAIVPRVRMTGAALLISVCTLAPAQEARDVVAKPSEPALSQSSETGSGSPGITSLGSLFSGVKAALPDAKPVDQDSAQGAISGYDKRASTGFNIVDIDRWSRTSGVVLDPQCKTMVQPFGLSDNAASLVVLAAKIKINGFFSQLGLAGVKQSPVANQESTAGVIKLAARNLNWLPMEAEIALGKSMLGEAEILDEDKNDDARRVYAEAGMCQ